jgi:hypothetical protein
LWYTCRDLVLGICKVCSNGCSQLFLLRISCHLCSLLYFSHPYIPSNVSIPSPSIFPFVFVSWLVVYRRWGVISPPWCLHLLLIFVFFLSIGVSSLIQIFLQFERTMIGSQVTRGNLRVSSKAVCIEFYCGDSDRINTVDSSTSGEGILYPTCCHLCYFPRTWVSRDIVLVL